MRALLYGITLAAVLMAASGAQAFTYDWSNATVISDPVEGNIAAGRDITGVMYDYNQADGNQYFRMDMAGPLSDAAPTTYAFYVNALTGGGNGADFDYVPDSLNGIDYIIDGTLDNTLFGDVGGWRYNLYAWNGSQFVLSGSVDGQASSTRVELRTGDIPGLALDLTGATHSPVIYDSTETVHVGGNPVPLPSTLAMLGSGILLFGRRRTNEKQKRCNAKL